jgi:hypothetical protein
MNLAANGPNAIADVNNFSNGITQNLDSVGNLSIKDVLNGATKGSFQNSYDKTILLKELINGLDRPILKGLALETITVLTNWFEDPEVPCCLIQGIWSGYAASVKLEDTDFVKYIDLLITFVDLILVFLSEGIKDFNFFIPDFIKEMTDATLGAILIVLQQLLFSIRDSLINQLMKALSFDMNGDSIWAKCLPLNQLTMVMKKYVHDYGIFAELFEKMRGYVAGQVSGFTLLKNSAFPQTVKDIEFLYWFRDLLIKLKTAAINFELCVNYGFSASSTSSISSQIYAPNVAGFRDGQQYPTPENAQGIITQSDGTILQDKEAIKANSVPVLANSSIREFLHKYYGYPYDMVDNLLTTSTSADSITGSNINSSNASNLNADCPNSPAPAEIVKWALRVRSRNT